jgi:hypothetical protein
VVVVVNVNVVVDDHDHLHVHGDQRRVQLLIRTIGRAR